MNTRLEELLSGRVLIGAIHPALVTESLRTA
jgi:hypothetical protein